MKIVIDIPEMTYNVLRGGYCLSKRGRDILCDAVKKGIPLDDSDYRKYEPPKRVRKEKRV